VLPRLGRDLRHRLQSMARARTAASAQWRQSSGWSCRTSPGSERAVARRARTSCAGLWPTPEKHWSLRDSSMARRWRADLRRRSGQGAQATPSCWPAAAAWSRTRRARTSSRGWKPGCSRCRSLRRAAACCRGGCCKAVSAGMLDAVGSGRRGASLVLSSRVGCGAGAARRLRVRVAGTAAQTGPLVEELGVASGLVAEVAASEPSDSQGAQLCRAALPVPPIIRLHPSLGSSRSASRRGLRQQTWPPRPWCKQLPAWQDL
jgi:hypothetical protein